jgi:hypothetical protein
MTTLRYAGILTFKQAGLLALATARRASGI